LVEIIQSALQPHKVRSGRPPEKDQVVPPEAKVSSRPTHVEKRPAPTIPQSFTQDRSTSLPSLVPAPHRLLGFNVRTQGRFSRRPRPVAGANSPRVPGGSLNQGRHRSA